MSKLLVVGTGAFAQVAADYFEEFGGKEVVGFAADPSPNLPWSFRGLPVTDINNVVDCFSPRETEVFVAIGHRDMNTVRENLASSLNNQGFRLASFVHPSVKLWPTTSLGDHTFIFESNTVQPFSTIGSNVVLWSGNHVGHHSVISDNTFVSTHVVVAGGASIGKNSFMGVNSSVADGMRVGDFCFVRPGANVTSDIPDYAIVSSPPIRFSARSTKDLFGTGDRRES